MKKKNNNIGLFGLIAIGVGGMVGGGIFAVLGEAVNFAHGATPIAFLVAGLVAILTSYSYAKLSVSYQNRGGTVIFIDSAFRHNLFSGTVNLMLWLSYLVTIALYAVAFASYAQTFFPGIHSIWLKHILISFAILFPAILNSISASIVSKSETTIVMVKIALLIIIIISSVSFVDTRRLAPLQWGSSLSIIVSGMVIFVAYEGFELIANAAEEVKNPASDLPRAFYGSTIIVIILYALISIVAVGTIPEAQLLKAKDYALAIAAKPALGQVGFVIVAVAALLATISAINATMFGNARLGYIIAKEGELPYELEEEIRGIPEIGIVIITLVSMALANVIDLTEIAIIGSASFLLIFSLVNLSAIKLRHKLDGNSWIFILAFLVSTGAFLTLMINTYLSEPKALFVFIGFIIISFFFEYVYGRIFRGHFFRRPYPNK